MGKPGNQDNRAQMIRITGNECPVAVPNRDGRAIALLVSLIVRKKAILSLH